MSLFSSKVTIYDVRMFVPIWNNIAHSLLSILIYEKLACALGVNTTNKSLSLLMDLTKAAVRPL